MDQTSINNKLEEAIKILTDIKNSLTPTVAIAAATEPDYNTFDQLKAVLLSDNWPAAVNPALICDPNSEHDKKERGIGIVELIIDQAMTKDQKFLDYGCGEGHCVLAAPNSLGCGLAVGYDPKQHNWPSEDKTKFTTSYEEAASLGPYDSILIFDVLDHVENESPVDLLKKAADLLADKGKIYIRTHP